jgi:phosphoribosylglycinamide formyltransferase-1
MKLAVLVSGTGSNLRAIAAAIDAGTCAASIALVVSDKETAPALDWARTRGVETAVVRPKSFTDRAAWDVALAECVAAAGPDLVVCAGFMRILGAPILARFPHRIVNVHPALLPSFPGTDGAAQAIAKGVRISGCTVHLVDAGVDTGPILAQAAVPVLPTDDPHSLQARIQVHEHKLLPAVIDAIARGAIRLGPTPVLSEIVMSPADALVSPPIER